MHTYRATIGSLRRTRRTHSNTLRTRRTAHHWRGRRAPAYSIDSGLCDHRKPACQDMTHECDSTGRDHRPGSTRALRPFHPGHRHRRAPCTTHRSSRPYNAAGSDRRRSDRQARRSTSRCTVHCRTAARTRNRTVSSPYRMARGNCNRRTVARRNGCSRTRGHRRTDRRNRADQGLRMSRTSLRR